MTNICQNVDGFKITGGKIHSHKLQSQTRKVSSNATQCMLHGLQPIIVADSCVDQY